ncbi:MAG: radical SAM protein [Candidatus Omnitrophica bacterium]|jgi:radical SAM protein with 4Fe4S-binding SPASM domain|nr:radical SAM protein [Candidatus Omnitrophota bacterium]MDD5512173.1 radical SAM protein [Candidatus Omnitrophota bacterium]
MTKKKIATRYSELDLVAQLSEKKHFMLITFQLTRRCNNNCRHCNVNLAADDAASAKNELSTSRIKELIDQAVAAGVLFGCFTGGEPLLRHDFKELYLYLKDKGVLPIILTNATLIEESHIELFKKYPPRNIEITVYGATRETYERVTRVAGSFERFRRGVDLLLRNRIKIELKGMILASNFHELPKIREFCIENSRPDPFRAEPFVYLRLDGDTKKNAWIKKERLKVSEIVDWELRYHPDCVQWIKENYCGETLSSRSANNRFFPCAIDKYDCTIADDGAFLFCPMLRHPDYSFSLEKMTIKEAFEALGRKIRSLNPPQGVLLEKCGNCKVKQFCLRCPGRCYAETGKPDRPSEYLCDIAFGRAKAYGYKL